MQGIFVQSHIVNLDEQNFGNQFQITGADQNQISAPINTSTMAEPIGTDSQIQFDTEDLGIGQNRNIHLISDSEVLELKSMMKKVVVEMERIERLEVEILHRNTWHSVFFSKRSLAIMILVPVLLAITYHIVVSQKELSSSNGVLVRVGGTSSNPIQTASADFVVGSDGHLSMRSPSCSSRRALNSSAPESCPQHVPISTSQFLVQGPMSSRLPDSTLEQMRILKFVDGTSFISFAVHAVARFQDSSSKYGSFVVIFVHLGNLTLDGETLSFDENLQRIFTEAGFSVDVTSNRRRLLGVVEILGFFNFITSQSDSARNETARASNVSVNSSVPAREFPLGNQSTYNGSNVEVLTDPPFIFSSVMKIITFCDIFFGPSTNSCEKLDGERVDWLENVDGRPALTRTERAYSLEFSGNLVAKSFSTTGQWPDQTYVIVQNESFKLTYQVYQDRKFHCLLEEDTTLLNVKLSRGQEYASRTVQFQGYITVNGVYCKQYEIKSEGFAAIVLENYDTRQIYQTIFSNVVWQFDELTSYQNSESLYPLEPSEFDLDKIFKSCAPAYEEYPAPIDLGHLTDKMLPKATWVVGNDPVGTEIDYSISIDNASYSDPYIFNNSELRTETLSMANKILRRSRPEQMHSSLHSGNSNDEKHVIPSMRRTIPACTQLPPVEFEYYTWSMQDCQDSVVHTVEASRQGPPRPCLQSNGSITIITSKVGNRHLYNGNLNFTIDLCQCQQILGIIIPKNIVDLGFCKMNNLFVLKPVSSVASLMEMQEETSCKNFDDLNTPQIGDFPLNPLIQFTESVSAGNGGIVLSRVVSFNLYIGVQCSSEQASNEGIWVGSSLQVSMTGRSSGVLPTVIQGNFDLDPRYSPVRTCSDDKSSLSILSNNGNYIYTSKFSKSFSFTNLMGTCLRGRPRISCRQLVYPCQNRTGCEVVGCKQGGVIARRSYGHQENVSYWLPAQYLEILSFNTQSANDVLQVFTCQSVSKVALNASCILHGSYSGIISPFVIFSMRGIFQLKWISDASVNAPGWEIRYSFRDTFGDILKLPLYMNNTNGFVIENAFLKKTLAGPTFEKRCLNVWNSTWNVDTGSFLGFDYCNYTQDQNKQTGAWSIRQTPDNFYYFIVTVQGKQRNMCLSQSTGGNRTTLSSCVGGLNRQWKLIYNGSTGYFQIRNRMDDSCIGAVGYQRGASFCTGSGLYSGCSWCTGSTCLRSSISNPLENRRCASFSLQTEQWIFSRVSRAKNQSIVVQEKSICNQKLDNAQRHFAPLAIQELFPFTIGVAFGVGTLDVSKKCEDDSTACNPCESLGQVMTDDSYVYVHVMDPKELFSKLPGGKDADELKTKRGATTVPAKPGFGALVSKVFDILPICVAVRPCSRSGRYLGQDSSFGFFSTPGVTLFEPEVTVKGQKFEVKIVINAFSFSQAGDLKPFDFDPPLFDDKVPAGMHLYADGAISFPIYIGSLEIGSLDFTGTLGVYANLNGEARIASFLSEIIRPDGTNLDRLVKSLLSQPALFQIFLSNGVKLTIDLKSVLRIDFKVEFDVFCKTIGMIEASYDIDATGHGVAALDFRFSASLATASMLKTLASEKFGKFGEVIVSSLPFVNLELIVQLMFRVTTDAMISLGFEFTLKVRFNCGVFYEIIQAVLTLIDSAASLFDKQGLRNEIIRIRGVVDSICGGQQQIYSIRLAVVDNRIDTRTTWISMTFPKVKLTLDMLPHCPPPVNKDGRCSLNSDCSGNGLKDGGYCLNHPTWKTSIGCMGRCIEKRRDGEICDKQWANLPPIQSWDPRKSEREACLSGVCICGKCGQANDNSPCSSNSDCTSGFCRDDCSSGFCITVGCKGACMSRLPAGGNCGAIKIASGLAAHQACTSSRCLCGRCANDLSQRLPDGSSCSDDSDCEGYCSGEITAGCKGICRKKMPPGSNCEVTILPERRHSACESGRCTCKICTNYFTARLPEGSACSEDIDCEGDYYCDGYLSTIGCSGRCKKKLDPFADCSSVALTDDRKHSACRSGKCFCGRCANTWMGAPEWGWTSGRLTTGYACSQNTDCETSCGNSYDNIITVGCKGRCRPWDESLDPGAVCDSDASCKSSRCLCGVCGNMMTRRMPNEAKCSKNDDCESGFCLGDFPSGCNGRCKPKIAALKDCSWVSTFPSNRHAACVSGRCLCGNCANTWLGQPEWGWTTGRLTTGYACSENADCENGCGGAVTAGCLGRCNPWDYTVPAGGECSRHQSCVSGQCTCGRCAQAGGRIADGLACSANSDCGSGSFCLGDATAGCRGQCRKKIGKLQDCGWVSWHPPNRHAACETGRCYCERCVNDWMGFPAWGWSSGRLIAGYACSQNSDCENGCGGIITFNCQGRCRNW